VTVFNNELSLFFGSVKSPPEQLFFHSAQKGESYDALLPVTTAQRMLAIKKSTKRSAHGHISATLTTAGKKARLKMPSVSFGAFCQKKPTLL
jgi:hypothetical protein